MSNDYASAWNSACGIGNSVGVDRSLGTDTGSPRSGYYRLRLCTAKNVNTCTTIWAHKIGEKPPKS